MSADALNLRKKGREPVFSQAERLAIVAALKPVDEVFVEESLELKRDYILQYGADVLVMGDDWAGPLRRVPGHLRGRLPAAHARDLDHGAHREDLRHQLTAPEPGPEPSAPGLGWTWPGHAGRVPPAVDARSPTYSDQGENMRRSIAAVVVAVSAALSVVPTGAATATDGSTTPSGSATSPLAQQQAGQALDRARAVLSGAAGATTDSRVEGTLAMRDLFAAYPALATTQRTEARRVLARPTDGTNDPYGDGYTVSAKRKCAGHFCIHWVPTTSDAPPSKAWVDTTLTTMNQVWRKEVGTLNYRRPIKDGHHGGSSKFDVYLKDVGADYLYGYCAPEYVKAGHPREASGYCVLDNDFASSQYGGAKPVNSLRVTAAHEFFHAVQFALRLQGGPVADGGDRHLDGGALRRRDQRQPSVPPLRPGPPAGDLAGRLQPAGLQPVRQLAVLRVPQQPLRQPRRARDLERRR